MANYEVIVSNIGTVYAGTNKGQALAEYAECVKASQDGQGRIGHEDVTLFENSEPIKEFYGKLHEND